VPKKFVLLSHRGGNIGHDFMAKGMEVILKDRFGEDIVISHIEQHNPFEVYPKWHILRLLHRVPHGRLNFLRSFLAKEAVTRFFWKMTSPADYDLAIACGGPNLVSGASNTPQMALMLFHMNGAINYRGAPLVDAGVGSCFPSSSKESLKSEADIFFYKKAASFCSAITVRDKLAEKVYRDLLGVNVKRIPCAAIASGRYFEQFQKKEKQYILINYMLKGANSDWGQGVDPDQWYKTVRQVVDFFSPNHQIVFLAHNSVEEEAAKNRFKEFQCILPRSLEQYAEVIGRAKIGFVSRIHAAIPLAGIGVSSLVIGTDSRLGAVEELGLPTLFVKEASAEIIIHHLSELLKKSENEKQRLLQVREQTIKAYGELFKSVVDERKKKSLSSTSLGYSAKIPSTTI
jgi:Polysaccharide pyruvyl transferase